jgi:hypothetical protein
MWWLFQWLIHQKWLSVTTAAVDAAMASVTAVAVAAAISSRVGFVFAVPMANAAETADCNNSCRGYCCIC